MQLQALCKLVVALVGLSAVGSVNAAPKNNTKNSNLTMSVGDGTTVQAKGPTTVFLGTEYNPAKCILQFDSLQCDDKSCGELNGYKLQCVTVDGKKKKKCQCSPDEADLCQSQNVSAVEGEVPQFGDCGSGRKCVDSFGHVPTGGEAKTCAEKLHCVKEIDSDASKPAEICHTCRSCIAQNDKANKELSSKKRFDCTKICPQEILDELKKRNKKGVGIADEFSSSSGSSSGSSSESGSSSGSTSKKKSNSTTDSTGSKKKSGTSKNNSATSPSAIVGAIVAVACSLAMLS